MFGWSTGEKREGGDGRNVLPDGRAVTLALYKFDSCPFCRRVYSAIDRLDVQLEYRDVRNDPAWRADLISQTGRGTVPCLFIDGEAMFESLDIVAWLQANFTARSA